LSDSTAWSMVNEAVDHHGCATSRPLPPRRFVYLDQRFSPGAAFALGKYRFFFVREVWRIRYLGNYMRVISLAEFSVRSARAERDNRMNTVLYFSPDGVVYETRAYSGTDIAELVHDYGLESLTSADRQFDFWFTPSTRRCRRKVNRSATEMLLATTRFTAKTVPLLCGAVVVATHDSDGDLDGLSWQQLDLLAQHGRNLGKRDDRLLRRRITREQKRQQRSHAAVDAATHRRAGKYAVAR
jgi:hypothetical protein